MNIKNVDEQGGTVTLEYRYNRYKRHSKDNWDVWSENNSRWYKCSDNGTKEVELEYQKSLIRVGEAA